MKVLTLLKEIGIRIVKSNNRSLGTIFGCIAGGAVGIIYVIDNSASLAIVGTPDTLAKQILAVLLATGTGGNLSSYIGATIDILSGEKTIFDLCNSLFNSCKSCLKAKTKESGKATPEIELITTKPPTAHEPKKHEHFPFITSFESEPTETEKKSLPAFEQNVGLFYQYKERLEQENKLLREENMELKRQFQVFRTTLEVVK